MPAPPSGGGVWCDTPVPNVRTTPPDGVLVHNKYGGSRLRGQSLLRYQPVCLWYHYTDCSFNPEKGTAKPEGLPRDAAHTFRAGNALTCVLSPSGLQLVCSQCSRVWKNAKSQQTSNKSLNWFKLGLRCFQVIWGGLHDLGSGEPNRCKPNQSTCRQCLTKVCVQQFDSQDKEWFGIF